MKPVLALDLDDLIFPFMQTFVPAYNAKHQADYAMHHYTTFDFWQLWSCTQQEAFTRTFDLAYEFSAVVTDHEPLEGAAEGISDLAKIFDLVIITARMSELRSTTEQWVEHHFPGVFEDVVLCSSYANDGRPTRRKIEVIEEFNAIGLVDDSVKNTSEAAEHGRRALLYGDYAWNASREQLPQSVEFATSWPEVVKTVRDWI